MRLPDMAEKVEGSALTRLRGGGVRGLGNLLRTASDLITRRPLNVSSGARILILFYLLLEML